MNNNLLRELALAGPEHLDAAYDARRFVEQLRTTSPNPVVYAELPGAQHAFDLFRSRRFDTVIDTIGAFATWVRSTQVQAAPAGTRGPHERPQMIRDRSVSIRHE